MTLGPSLILLALLDGVKAESGLSWFLLVYGRVPLFYYVIHLYLIHILAILAALASHQPVWHGPIVAAPTPLGYGHGLPLVYAIWILVVVMLYLPCRWFMNVKSRHRDWAWLSYL
jgi:hypothetical protein